MNRFYKQGLETGIAAFFIVLFLYKMFEFEQSWRSKRHASKDLIVLGILGICVVLSRLDLVFFVAIAGIWLVFRGSPLRYLLPLDIVSFMFSVLLAFVLRLSFDEYYMLSHEAVKMLVVSLFVKISLAYAFSLYQRSTYDHVSSFLRSFVLFVLISSGAMAIIMIILARLLEFDNFPRTILMYDAIATIILLGLTRLIFIGLKTAEAPSTGTDSPVAHNRSNWSRWLQDGIAYYGVAFGGLAIYMLWNKIAFGTFSPVSGQIKRWWGSLTGRVYGGPARSFSSFFGVDYQGDANAWHPVSTLLGSWAEQLYSWRILDFWRYVILVVFFSFLFFFVFLFNKKNSKKTNTRMGVIPLLCGSWLQVFYYHTQGYSAYKEWYWISQLVLIIIVLCLIFGMLYQAIRKTLYVQRIFWGIAILFGAYMVMGYGLVIQNTMTYNDWSPHDPYMDLAVFLERYTEPGSTIGLTGGGNVGYFVHDRTVINMDGLINSYEYFELLKKKEAGQYLADIGMDYILASMDLLDGLPYRGQFNNYMEWMDINYGGKDLVRYHPTLAP
jgi:hypothetical protein